MTFTFSSFKSDLLLLTGDNIKNIKGSGQGDGNWNSRERERGHVFEEGKSGSGKFLSRILSLGNLLRERSLRNSRG